jgi:hypothetical protein
MPSDLPSVLPPSATLDKVLYSDLIIALEYDLAFPPHAPFKYVVEDNSDNSGSGSISLTSSSLTSNSTLSLKDYAVRAILREFVGAVEKKDLLAAWIEVIASCPRARWDEIIQAMRKVYPRCANRLAGRDVSPRKLSPKWKQTVEGSSSDDCPDDGLPGKKSKIIQSSWETGSLLRLLHTNLPGDSFSRT